MTGTQDLIVWGPEAIGINIRTHAERLGKTTSEEALFLIRVGATFRTALFNSGDLTCIGWIEFGQIHNFDQSLTCLCCTTLIIQSLSSGCVVVGLTDNFGTDARIWRRTTHPVKYMLHHCT